MSLASPITIRKSNPLTQMTRPTQTQALLTAIGQTLAGLRIKAGYPTLKGFAQAHGLAEIQYWRIEHGKANTSVKTLVKLARIHGVEVKDLMK